MPQFVKLDDTGSTPAVHPTLMHDDGASELRCLQNIIVWKYICKERNLDRAPKILKLIRILHNTPYIYLYEYYWIKL